MERHWLIPALAAVALVAAPVRADEAPGGTPPASDTPAVASGQPQPAGQEVTPTPSAPAGTLIAQGQPTAPATPGAPATEKKPEPPAPPPPPKFTYGGSADGYFSTNLNDPNPQAFGRRTDPLNLYRAFDIKDEHGPHLGLIDLWAQYARSPIGGRLDVDFGPTARLVNAFEPSHGNFWEHIQQAYISANLDGKKGRTYIDAGKWVTTAGSEVIEPKDNWLYTRSLLFTLAIPFYHMGGRVYHYFNDTDYVMAGVHRGWNAVGDPHHDPGFVIAGNKALSKVTSLTANYYGGEEFGGGPGLGGTKGFRNLLDLILAYTPPGKLAYNLNVDLANQRGATWYGFAAMAKYQLAAKHAITVRGEVLRDNSGLISGLPQTLGSVTLGYTYQANKYLQVRPEYRHDFSNKAVYPLSLPGTFSGGQDTLLISLIAMYH